MRQIAKVLPSSSTSFLPLSHANTPPHLTPPQHTHSSITDKAFITCFLCATQTDAGHTGAADGTPVNLPATKVRKKNKTNKKKMTVDVVFLMCCHLKMCVVPC